MGSVVTVSLAAKPAGSQPATTYKPALTLLASLFFMWGFATVLNNTLLPHLRSVFALSYMQATLIESVWFIAYFVASIPAAKLIERVGYKRALVTALATRRSFPRSAVLMAQCNTPTICQRQPRSAARSRAVCPPAPALPAPT